MINILVVDDTPFWRDIVADALRRQHYSVQTAFDGMNALTLLWQHAVDLIVLDVDMPQIQGLTLLGKIRANAKWRQLPVIMLTGDMQKDHVLLAKKLGAADYLLKARFSPKELLERVQKLVPVTANVPLASPPGETRDPGVVPQLITQEACFDRTREALSGRTLAGVVAEVIASAGSSTIHLSELATSVGRDAILTAKLLQAANEAMHNGSRAPVVSLCDAVRVVGCTGVRNIAATIGIFEAMPAVQADGFDPIRAWQHSLAVATLCDRLAPPELKSEAYLIGLCHNLGEILFHTHFGTEYKQVLELHKVTGQPLEHLEAEMLGASRGVISQRIIRALGLPEKIIKPIDHFYRAARSTSAVMGPLNKILQIAENYATGSMVASSVYGMVRSFTRGECAECAGESDPPRPDDAQLRGDIFAMTAVYLRVPPRECKASSRPLVPQSNTKLLVVRDPALSQFDPITAALEAMAQTDVSQSIPHGDQLQSYDGLILIGPCKDGSASAIAQVESLIAGNTSTPPAILLLCNRKTEQTPKTSARIATAHWPISLRDLQVWIQGISRKTEQALPIAV